jgi:NAD(P)-dependent dehydrogenase (short-subunit alcohol dehydrogenase family)
MVSQLLQRPNTVVIATSRTPESVESPTSIHATSKLIPLALDLSDGATGTATLVSRLAALSPPIMHLNVVVANAGSSAGFNPILSTSSEDLVHDFRINAVGPFELLKASWPLLNKSDNKKFVLITSTVGSIAIQDQEPLPSTAYGMSKAAANWFAKKASVEFKQDGLLVGIIHPGYVLPLSLFRHLVLLSFAPYLLPLPPFFSSSPRQSRGNRSYRMVKLI